jgi:alpha-aminoadipate/glutamate carrier protein LysW
MHGRYSVVPGREKEPRSTEAIMVICPECESDLDIEEDEVDEGEIVSCPECGSDFEVVAIEPLELTRVEDEAEEDDDEEDEKEEEGDY